MEFLKQNYINTTTMLTVNSNTGTASNLFNPDEFYQYYTDGLNNDATTNSITVTFDATTSVSRIAFLGINIKSFTFFYNGLTANAFSITNGATTTSNYSNNSASSLYFQFNTIQCSSITFDFKSTIVANQEKHISLLVVSDLYYSMAQIPSAKDYNPTLTPKQIVHKMSDGGTRIHNVRKKWDIRLGLEHINTSMRDSLKTIYDLQSAFMFAPFHTHTGWDGILFESVWDGDFGFYEYSNNAASSGFSGNIKIKETSA